MAVSIFNNIVRKGQGNASRSARVTDRNAWESSNENLFDEYRSRANVRSLFVHARVSTRVEEGFGVKFERKLLKR